MPAPKSETVAVPPPLDSLASSLTLDPPSSPDSSDIDSGTHFRSPPPKTFSQKTLTIFDYDDTFLPSTYLAALGLRVDDFHPLPPGLVEELTALEAQVIAILKESVRHGIVKIITNAEEGWIELSGKRFMPKLTSFLLESPDRVKLVSARTRYERLAPKDPSAWKIAAFVAEVEHDYPEDSDLNVIVIGDSLSERDAAHVLSENLPESHVKSVKLVEGPTISQLHRQLTLLSSTFGPLAAHYSSFDVDLEC